MPAGTAAPDEPWRAVGSAAWDHARFENTKQRTAMVIAAFILDCAHEYMLADWLLCARPEHAREVATIVAVNALRRDVPAAWDAFVAVETMDHRQAAEWLDVDEVFTLSPADDRLAVRSVAEDGGSAAYAR